MSLTILREALARRMYPYITIGSFHLGTFGLFLWLAAVAAGVVLHKSFVRDGVDADALNVVCLVVLAGVLGAKTWHELQNPAELQAAMHKIFAPGMQHLGQVLLGLGEWMRSGIAWFGGLLAGIAMLMVAGSAGEAEWHAEIRRGRAYARPGPQPRRPSATASDASAASPAGTGLRSRDHLALGRPPEPERAGSDQNISVRRCCRRRYGSLRLR